MPQFHFKTLGITVNTGMTVMTRVIEMARVTDNKND